MRRFRRTVSLPTTIRSLLGQLPIPVIDGWLRVDSPSVSINGEVVVKSGAYLTTIPLQRTAAERMTFSQLSDTPGHVYDLVVRESIRRGGGGRMTFLRLDGTVIGQRTLAIPSSGQLVGNRMIWSRRLREWSPDS